MYKSHEIRTVHLEITDKCNAACPMCARNINGGEDNPQLPGTELSIDDIKQIFRPEFIRQLDRMYMCGNYGDPIAARDTLETFQYFREHNAKINLSMHTNGSAKKPDWWRQLAYALGSKGVMMMPHMESYAGAEALTHMDVTQLGTIVSQSLAEPVTVTNWQVTLLGGLDSSPMAGGVYQVSGTAFPASPKGIR